jgi:filamentous hemagglutinin family protein
MLKHLLSFSTSTVLFLIPIVVQAQNYNRTPVADGTSIRTKVEQKGNDFTIRGGKQRGDILFHSFKDFSVPTGGAAYFKDGSGVNQIITRVTGDKISEIDGRVKTQGAGFLLINPNGAVFGPNTKLDVAGTFKVTTAKSVDLKDPTGKIYTFGVNGQGDRALLNVNANVILDPVKLSFRKNPVNGKPNVTVKTVTIKNEFGMNVQSANNEEEADMSKIWMKTTRDPMLGNND